MGNGGRRIAGEGCTFGAVQRENDRGGGGMGSRRGFSSAVQRAGGKK